MFQRNPEGKLFNLTIAEVLERLAKELGIVHGDIQIKVVNGKVSFVEAHKRFDLAVLCKELKAP